MANIAGLLSTNNAQTNDLVGEWQQGVLVRNAKGMNTGTTLFGLMSKLKNEPAENTVFNWFEREPTRLNFYSNAGFSASTTTLTFTQQDLSTDATPLLASGTQLYNNRTAEYVLVAADSVPPNVVVTRAINGSTSAIINSGDVWSRVSIAKTEGASATRAAFEEPVVVTNNIQTFNSTVEISNAFKANVLRTDSMGPLKERQAQALERITKDIELQYFLGVKGTLNNNQYFTGGIKNAIDTGAPTANVLNGQGATGCTLSAFKAWLQSFMPFGSDSKLAFCGPKSYEAVSNYANTATGGFRIFNQEVVFGMAITTIVTPQGFLDLVFHPLFQQMILLNDYMVVVDLELITQKVMEPLCLLPNQQLPDADSYKEQFRAKLGLKLKFVQAFGYAFGLQSIIVG